MSMLPVVGARLSVTGTREFNAAFQQAAGSVQNFGDIALANFRAVGAGMVVLGGTILAAAKAFATGAADFEKEMRNVQTISIEAQKSFQDFSRGVYDVARETNQSATEAARGLYEIVSSGFDGADALSILEHASVAASAGLAQVSTSVTAILAVLNAYGQSGAEAQDVSDTLFQTVNLGIGSFEELAGSVGQVVGLASQAKVSFGEVSAAIAATSRSGISFDEAATGVNRILQELLDPTDQLRGLLQQLGYETGLQALQQDGLHGVLEKIRGEVGENAAAYVTLFGRIEATRTALALAADDGETYAEAIEKISDKTVRAGAAAQAFKVQQQSLNAKTKDLQNTIESLGTSALLPVLIFLNKIEGAMKKFLDMVDKLHPVLKAGLAISTIFAGILLTGLGAAFVLLPRLILVAMFAMIRYNTTVKTAIVETLALAQANSALAASAKFLFRVLTDTQLVTGIGKGIAKWSFLVGIIGAGLTALAIQAESVDEKIAKIVSSATNLEVTAFAKQIAESIELLETLDKGVIPDPTMGIPDKIAAQFGWETGIVKAQRARKAFQELARTNREVAVRLLESAKAAGVNAEAIEFMETTLRTAEQASKETSEAMGEAASEFTTSSGQIILVTDDIKDSLDDFRDQAAEIKSGFGDMFANPADSARDLAKAVDDARSSVKDAEADLAAARRQAGSDASNDARSRARADRDVIRARRELQTLESKRPRRQRGESREEFELRKASELEDARMRVADAEDAVRRSREGQGDATRRITEAEEKLAEAREKERKATEAQVVTGQSLIEALREQGKVLADLFTNFATLRTRGFTEPMIAELRELGPQGAAQIAALAKMTDTELKEYRRLWMDNAAFASGISLNPLETNPGAVQAKLEELWVQTGGDAAKFMQLGAAAGATAIEKFLTNKFQSLAEGAASTLYNALPPEIKIKLTIFPGDANTASALSALSSGAIGPGGLQGDAGAFTADDRRRGGIGSETSRFRDYGQYAEGGIFNKPTLGVFGEDGAEAIIPLTKPGRAIDLMRESGLLSLARKVSVPMFAAGGIVGARSIANSTTDRSSHVGYSYQIGQVVANDPMEFNHKMHRQQRLHALMGLSQ